MLEADSDELAIPHSTTRLSLSRLKSTAVQQWRAEDGEISTPGVSIRLNPLHSALLLGDADDGLGHLPDPFHHPIASPLPLKLGHSQMEELKETPGHAEHRKRLLAVLGSVQQEMSTLEHELCSWRPPSSSQSNDQHALERALKQISELMQERDELRDAHSCLSRQLEQSGDAEAELARVRRERDHIRSQLIGCTQQNSVLENRCKDLEKGHMALVSEVERLDWREDERSRKLSSLEAALHQKTVSRPSTLSNE